MKRAVVVVAAVMLLAACGGGHDPKLPPGLAQQWRADATCTRADELRASVIAAINAHRIPQALQEPLTSKVNALASGSCDAQRAHDLADWLEENS
jgi:hypothetical protein